MESARAAVALAIGLAVATGAAAQSAAEFPSRPIRLIVPVAPGGGNDITARFIAQKMTRSFGQQVVVDKLSRAVAAGVHAPDVAQRLAADGSTSVGSTPEQFAGVIRDEIAKWRKVLKDTGIAVN